MLMVVLAGLCAGSGKAQTLARRNWVGSGITVAPWWRGAVFYQIDPISFQDTNGDGFGDLPGLVERLDYVESLGVDALVLSPFSLGPGRQPLDAAYGSEEDFERLIAEATRRHLRVLVDLPLAEARSRQGSESELLGQARFWLIRGVAGLRLRPDAAGNHARQAQTLRALRKLVASFAGQRVLLLASAETAAEACPEACARSRAVPARRRRSRGPDAEPAPAGEAPLLPIDNRLSAATALDPANLRSLLGSTGSGETMLLASDTDERPRSFDRDGGSLAREWARLVAAALLLGAHDPLLLFGQEIGMASGGSSPTPAPMQWGGSPGFPSGFTSGVPWIEMGPNADRANVAEEDGDPDSLLTWYRRLGALRHAYPALHGGSLTLLPTANPRVVAWVRRGRTGESAAPVVVVANLSASEVMIALGPELIRAGLPAALHGLRTLAPAYGAARNTETNAVVVPAYAVYVGELRAQSGLETVVLPPRARRMGR